MVTKRFVDEENVGNVLELWVNDKSRIFIQCGDFGDNFMLNGYVTLSKEDAIALVDELNVLIGML